MMQPRPGPKQQGEQRGVPSIVLFEWGSFVFEGYIDSYKETLDYFFAPEGVPLRSTLSLSLTEQEKPFPAPRAKPVVDDREVVPTAPDRSIDGFANDLGVSRQAAQAIARDNGIENSRLPGVDQLAVPRSNAPRQPQALAAPRAATRRGQWGRRRDWRQRLRQAPFPFAGARASATNGTGTSALAAFDQLRTPPEIRLETPRLDLGGSLGAGATAALDLRAGIGVGGAASAGISTSAPRAASARAAASSPTSARRPTLRSSSRSPDVVHHRGDRRHDRTAAAASGALAAGAGGRGRGRAPRAARARA